MFSFKPRFHDEKVYAKIDFGIENVCYFDVTIKFFSVIFSLYMQCFRGDSDLIELAFTNLCVREMLVLIVMMKYVTGINSFR
jgi:hypothetical protein